MTYILIDIYLHTYLFTYKLIFDVYTHRYLPTYLPLYLCINLPSDTIDTQESLCLCTEHQISVCLFILQCHVVEQQLNRLKLLRYVNW